MATTGKSSAKGKSSDHETSSSRRRGRSGDEVGPWTEKLKRHLDCLQEQNEQGTIQVEMIDQFKAEVDGLRKAMQLQLRGPQARPRHPDNPEDSQVPPVFERIETKGAQCHSNVKNQLHDLQVILDDEAASAPRSKPLRDQARQSSGTYQSVDLGIRIILCKVLQDCYNRCVSHLIEESTEAVVLFQSDASQFTQEVIGCMNHAFHLKLSCGKGKDSHSDHLSSDQVAQQARKLMLTVTTPKRELPDTDMKKYAAVYALAMSYLDGRRGSDVQEGILIEMELMNYPNWKSFVNKVVPICWELATIYMPPIFMCATKDQMVFDDVCHERHPKSAVSHIIQSYIFPLVYRDHRGEICKKAVVLTKFLDRREMY